MTSNPSTSNPSITIDLTPKGTMERLEWLAWFSDSAIKVPGTNRSVGADGLVSMVPGVGSLVGTGMSLYVFGEAVRHGAPAHLLARMAFNIAADTLLGAIPVVGFLFDFVFKANQRNLHLLREHMRETHR